jgi:membrane protease YdiL (CAAX protease family)
MGKLRDQLTAAQIAREKFERNQSDLVDRTRRSDRELSLTYLLAGLAAFYLVISFGATKQLDAIGEYTSYIFEIGLVGFAVVLLRPHLSLRRVFKPLTLLISFISLVVGFAVLKIARISGLAVPIDVNNKQTVIFLLAVAPVLEELIFRFMLFKPFERIWNSKFAMVATSLLFSYSHLHAIWFVPPEYDKFIIYQALYTLPLAFACAWMIRRQTSLLSAILVHAMFNLGFFLAFWY